MVRASGTRRQKQVAELKKQKQKKTQNAWSTRAGVEGPAVWHHLEKKLSVKIRTFA